MNNLNKHITNCNLYDLDLNISTEFKSADLDVGICICIDNIEQPTPYFIFYNSVDFYEATKEVRILFTAPNNVCNHSKYTRSLWKLNNTEKQLLMKILKQPSPKHYNMNIWNVCKYVWNWERFEVSMCFNNYIKGKYDKNKSFAQNLNYIPYSLEMPDYTKLKFD